MQIIWAALYLALTVYSLLLVVRIVFEVVQQYARQWRPKGAALILASATYAVTDPPLRWLRGKIPMRMGGLNLDFSFIIVFFAVAILKMIVRVIALS